MSSASSTPSIPKESVGGRDIIISTTWGGFSGISKGGLAEYRRRRLRDVSSEADDEHTWSGERDDPVMAQVVKDMGSAACISGSLGVVTIPADVDWELKEYDGIEWVAEKHRKWFASDHHMYECGQGQYTEPTTIVCGVDTYGKGK